MNDSAISIMDHAGFTPLTLDLLNPVQDQSLVKHMLECGPILEQQYFTDWVIKRRDEQEVVQALTASSPPTTSPVDKDILDIKDVAVMLKSTIDTVRRIPKEDLAVFDGPGRANLYLREFVIEYVKQLRKASPIDANLIDELL